MDPASVVGLVAACSSLVKVCGAVVTTLHSLVETYRHAELAILSITEECETIQFAWTRIEQWAAGNLHTMENLHQLGDRLQRSVYTGELIMAALRQDLAGAIPKTGNFRRRTSLAWNDSLFREHQIRIRGQVTALQLLLQVINMPRNDDRLEVLTVKEKVFRDADESAKSIIPSHLSSRMSTRDSIATSTRTRNSVELQYVPYEFDNDLFTSYVYKRNYRLPFMTRFFSSRRSTHSRTARSHRNIDAASAPQAAPQAAPDATVQEHELKHECLPVQSLTPKPEDSFESIFLPSTGTLTYLTLKHLSLGPNHRLLELLLLDAWVELQKDMLAKNFRGALDKLQNGFDVEILFRPEQNIWLPLTLELLGYILCEEPCLFVILTERLTYLAGTRWIRIFRNCIMAVKSVGERPRAELWKKMEVAATTFDKALARVPYVWTEVPTALQLAYSDNNFGVVSYLLNAGRRSIPIRDPDHPIALDAPIANMTTHILAEWLRVPPNVLAVALWQPISNEDYREYIKWHASASSLVQHHCADVNSMVQYQKRRLPLVHAVLYLIHDRRVEAGMSTAIFELLASKGVDPDRCGDVRWRPSRSISALALAATLGEPLLMDMLVKMGATLLWTNDVRVFDEASNLAQDVSFNSILKALHWSDNQPRFRRDEGLMAGLKRLALAYGERLDCLADQTRAPERPQPRLPNSPVFSPRSDEIADKDLTFDRTLIESIRSLMSVPQALPVAPLDLAASELVISPPSMPLSGGTTSLHDDETWSPSPIPSDQDRGMVWWN